MTRKTRVLSFIIAGVVALDATMCYTLLRSGRRAGSAEVEDRDKVTISERSLRADCDAVSSTPLWALGFSEVAMATNTCQHMIVMCAKSHHPAILSEILPLVGKSGEYVLIHQETMSRGNNTKSRYVRNFKTLERWVSSFMRNEVGVKGFGTTYMLRKECGKYNTEKHGPLYATKLLGNSPAILFNHYVPLEKLNFRQTA